LEQMILHPRLFFGNAVPENSCLLLTEEGFLSILLYCGVVDHAGKEQVSAL